MKKNSKMQTRISETVGIDLGDKVSRYCILDQDGEVVEEGSFRNQASSIEKHFSGERRRIALEAGAQSAWISRELQRLGHEVIVANARQLQWITASDTKNDPRDAHKLARLARADVRLLAPVEHRTAGQQAELAVIRARDALLRSRTLLINSARGIAKGFGVRLPKSITSRFGQRAMGELPEPLKVALGGVLEQIDALSRQIADYDQQIGQLAAQHPEIERLTSIPGVGTLTGLTFVLTCTQERRRPAHLVFAASTTRFQKLTPAKTVSVPHFSYPGGRLIINVAIPSKNILSSAAASSGSSALAKALSISCIQRSRAA